MSSNEAGALWVCSEADIFIFPFSSLLWTPPSPPFSFSLPHFPFPTSLLYTILFQNSSRAGKTAEKWKCLLSKTGPVRGPEPMVWGRHQLSKTVLWPIHMCTCVCVCMYIRTHTCEHMYAHTVIKIKNAPGLVSGMITLSVCHFLKKDAFYACV